MNLMDGHILPALLIPFVIMIVYLLPLAVAIWAVITLHRLRTTQMDMQAKLNAIEQLLRR